MQRKTEKQIFAHSIAKQIHDFAKANYEMDSILEMVAWNLKYCRRLEKTDIQEYPVDEWGNKIEMSFQSESRTRKQEENLPRNTISGSRWYR